MEAAKPNGVASATDFRKLAEDQAFEPAERVVLPKSGLAVMLRRPRPIAFTLFGRPLPASLSVPVGEPSGLPPRVEAGGQSPPLQMTPEELAALSKFWVEIFERMFQAPKLSLNPQPDEIHPNWLPAEDARFLIRWAVGEVVPMEGHRDDLAEFRGAGRSGAAARATGDDVELPPVGAAVGEDGALPN